jgi:H+/Cl- antiporter ClcA
MRLVSTHREGGAYLKLVLIAAAIGIPAALVAALFLALVHELESLLWDDLPDQLGYDSPPAYLVIGLPVVGALIVILARRLLPGDGGNPPTEGMALQATPVAYAPGIALAAIGTLAFGAVLGPEAPVVALGAIVGVAATHFINVGEQEQRVLSTAGSFSAISALFGGPLTAGMLLLEGGVGMGAKLIPALLPGLVAAAVGYVIFTGFGDWGGLDAPGLVVPDLPAYKGTFLGDLLVALAVGVATAVAIAMVRRAVAVVEREGLPRLGMAGLLLAGGLAVGLLALVVDAFGANPQEVLFSGQNSIPEIVSEGSAGVVAAVLVAKLLAYAASLGAGFRGGPIFPAVFLGVGIASLAVAVFDTSATWAIAVGAGAGMAAQARLLLAPVVFGALLVGQAGADTAPAAVLAVAAAWLVTTALDKSAALPGASPSPATPAPTTPATDPPTGTAGPDR